MPRQSAKDRVRITTRVGACGGGAGARKWGSGRMGGPPARSRAGRLERRAPNCGGLGLRLGLRARLWRVATETDARGLILEAADLQALREMARPGLEPGTPRFSGSRPVACLHTKSVQYPFLGRSYRGAIPSASAGLARVWDSADGSKSQRAKAAPQPPRGSICRVCDARVPDRRRVPCKSDNRRSIGTSAGATWQPIAWRPTPAPPPERARRVHDGGARNRTEGGAEWRRGTSGHEPVDVGRRAARAAAGSGLVRAAEARVGTRPARRSAGRTRDPGGDGVVVG
jgi:hypothetical protein